MSLSWWPYPISPKEALKKSSFILAGVCVGVYIMNSYFHPMEELTKEYDSQKEKLLKRYTKIFEERKIRELLDESAKYSHQISQNKK